MDGVHIFIILMLALICSSCLGSFMREGYENSNENKYPNVEDDQLLDPDSNEHDYDDMYRNLDKETTDYSNSQHSKGKKTKPRRSKEDYDDNDNEDNNINSYGNVNKYPDVEYDNILMAGNGKGRNGRNGSNGSNGPSKHVSRSQIPPGDEDLYILKSQVVPPVCPACPTVTSCPSEKQKCPPCPPCARCPEPAFECKKVPNYSGQNDSYLPQPVMSDFSQFGL